MRRSYPKIQGLTVIGLTGGMGMGKSTVALMFRELGVPVFDADAAVHKLQAKGGRAVKPLAEIFPEALKDGQIDRSVLRSLIKAEPLLLRKLEKILFPMVRQEENSFLKHQRMLNRRCAVLDIPLLFESGGDCRTDFTATVSAPARVQKQRILARGKMDEATVKIILSSQMTDQERRRRADFIIPTGLSLALTRKYVRQILREVL